MALPITDTDWVPEDTWGARLALVRQHMGWNYEQAGKACDIEPETWRQWEKRGRSPRKIHEIARRIASVSGANYVWLMAGGELARSRCFSPLALVSDVPGQMELAFDAMPVLELVGV
jgi:transcriptional regulator with XRE-family HTH domain